MNHYGKVDTTTSKSEDFYNGTFRACCHDIDFYYRLDKGEVLCDDDMDQLDTGAEERAREMIAEDIVEGELCTHVVIPYDDIALGKEFRGFWNIRRAHADD